MVINGHGRPADDKSAGPGQGGGKMAPPEEKQTPMECALCGYTASGKFVGDICPQCNMTYWRCSNCHYTLTAVQPPEECPGCDQKTDFENITCYTPGCGGPGHIDPKL
ncbi:MAG: rubredoxin-like domain-containing protein [Thermodesulfobacteriota bacterium]